MIGIAGFFIAVGVASAILFMLMVRADRIRDRRRAYVDSTGDTAGISAGSDGFSLVNWFSGSSPSSSSDDSCTSSSSSSFSGDSSDGAGGSGGEGGGD